MPNFETTYVVPSKTYVKLFHTAWHLLDMGERHEEGKQLNLQAATVFFAFAFEAYLNHVGAEELSFWDEIDRISFKKKLTVLSKHVGFTKDLSKRPLQTILHLLELRNKLAHGSTQNETIKESSDLPPPKGAAWRLLPWEKLTPESVRQHHDDVHAAIELINSARRAPDDRLWNQGPRGYESSTGW